MKKDVGNSDVLFTPMFKSAAPLLSFTGLTLRAPVLLKSPLLNRERTGLGEWLLNACTSRPPVCLKFLVSLLLT